MQSRSEQPIFRDIAASYNLQLMVIAADWFNTLP
jgi:hypothetical protein